uniref:Uncharacterized protein n=1 Tax=viral metagenome TaxID=1070528 RepID=A0A6M3LNS9_9ZZZZ
MLREACLLGLLVFLSGGLFFINVVELADSFKHTTEETPIRIITAILSAIIYSISVFRLLQLS